MKFERVTLEGRYVRLEPLTREHREGLAGAIEDGELWKLFFTIVPPVDRLDGFLGDAEAAWEQGDGLAFATVDRATGRVAGSTRFMRASLPDRRVEIGFTFLGKSFQRTGVNTEAKLLMLTHAFETLGLNRVEFLTDFLNQTSRNAILRLGAKEEGILRSHKVMSGGRVRDSVIFGITRYDWPGVRQHLQYKLGY